MKPIFTLVFVFLSFSGLVSAQNKQGHWQELIIQVPGIASERGFPEIKNSLMQLDGIQIYTFCQSQYLIFIKINKTILPDNKAVLDKIKQAGFDFYVKENITFAKALSVCKPEEIPDINYESYEVE